MNISGSVASQSTGLPLKGVTIWEIQADGQGATVIGYTDQNGNYAVYTDQDNSNVNFVTDGYTGYSSPVSQVATTDQILLAPENVATATLTLKNIPAWIWLALGLGFLYLNDKKRK